MAKLGQYFVNGAAFDVILGVLGQSPLEFKEFRVRDGEHIRIRAIGNAVPEDLRQPGAFSRWQSEEFVDVDRHCGNLRRVACPGKSGIQADRGDFAQTRFVTMTLSGRAGWPRGAECKGTWHRFRQRQYHLLRCR
jgi:hypothetical protein